MRVDIDGCITAVLSTGEFPMHFFDTERGDVCIIDSNKSLDSFAEKIGTSRRYLDITHFDDKDYDDIMMDFIDLVSTMGSKRLSDRLKKILVENSWKGTLIELEKDTEGWIHAWDQHIHDEGYTQAVAWLMNISNVKITEKFEGCGDCEICKAMEGGKNGYGDLMEAFTQQNMKPQLHQKVTRLSRPIPTHVLQLKIELTNSKPLVWRRILIPDSYSFFDLHVAIQDVMPWFGGHLHQFFDKTPYISRDYRIIKYPDPNDDVDFGFGPSIICLDETQTVVTDFLKKEKDKVWYEYDFGDGWMHKITLEKMLPYTEGVKLPDILAGKNMCPWEDSGGLGGFYEKISILKDTKHKDYKEIREWLEYIGEDIPEDISEAIRVFDKEEVIWSDLDKELKIFRNYFK